MADLDSAAACTNAYSDIEEDFFRTGDAMSTGSVAEPIIAETTEPVRTKSLWARLFERPLRLPTEDLLPEKPAVEVAEDDVWDWMLAVARALTRHATQPGM
jgi:hypothetical protein